VYTLDPSVTVVIVDSPEEAPMGAAVLVLNPEDVPIGSTVLVVDSLQEVDEALPGAAVLVEKVVGWGG